MPIIIKHRGTGGAAGAPPSLKTGEIAYNMADGYFYVGYGDDGSGNATSIKAFAADDFNVNQLAPAGGADGDVLTKSSGSDYAFGWEAPTGTTYTADGNGIVLTGTIFSLDFTEIATGISLANYAPLASPAFTGNPTAPNQTAGTNNTRIANTAYVDTGLATKAAASHVHAGEDITSGTIDPARLPAAVFQAPIVSSGAIAALDAGQQTAIVEGSHVVTTDGRVWIYSGSGSKTTEASYVELADKTPEWSAIANKPANVTSLAGLSGAADKAFYFSATNTLTQYDISSFGRGVANWADAAAGRTGLGLGTMATQAASAVAITGGTIDGVTIDGGTF